ncbi:hypothetical protein SAMN05428939_7652 [Streptomyces sp. TLI_105]|nr:hypothetical protein SAMN05428939_7652 [Streptomyces sp. TLI_105]
MQTPPRAAPGLPRHAHRPCPPRQGLGPLGQRLAPLGLRLLSHLNRRRLVEPADLPVRGADPPDGLRAVRRHEEGGARLVGHDAVQQPAWGRERGNAARTSSQGSSGPAVELRISARWITGLARSVTYTASSVTARSFRCGAPIGPSSAVRRASSRPWRSCTVRVAPPDGQHAAAPVGVHAQGAGAVFRPARRKLREVRSAGPAAVQGSEAVGGDVQGAVRGDRDPFGWHARLTGDDVAVGQVPRGGAGNGCSGAGREQQGGRGAGGTDGKAAHRRDLRGDAAQDEGDERSVRRPRAERSAFHPSSKGPDGRIFARPDPSSLHRRRSVPGHARSGGQRAGGDRAGRGAGADASCAVRGPKVAPLPARGSWCPGRCAHRVGRGGRLRTGLPAAAGIHDLSGGLEAAAATPVERPALDPGSRRRRPSSSTPCTRRPAGVPPPTSGRRRSRCCWAAPGPVCPPSCAPPPPRRRSPNAPPSPAWRPATAGGLAGRGADRHRPHGTADLHGLTPLGRSLPVGTAR